MTMLLLITVRGYDYFTSARWTWDGGQMVNEALSAELAIITTDQTCERD